MNGPLTTPAPFDFEQPRQNIERSNRRFDHRHGVQEPALLRTSHGLGLMNPADGDDRTEILEPGQTGPEVIEAVTQVGSEGDRHPRHAQARPRVTDTDTDATGVGNVTSGL